MINGKKLSSSYRELSENVFTHHHQHQIPLRYHFTMTREQQKKIRKAIQLIHIRTQKGTNND